MERNIKTVPVKEIHLDHRNTRQYIDPQALADLQADIKKNGLINPITLIPRDGGGYTLVAGERRFRAVVNLGKEMIWAHVREGLLCGVCQPHFAEHLGPVDRSEGVGAVWISDPWQAKKESGGLIIC